MRPEEDRAFSWFPGHMARGLREIEQDLKLVDLVILVLDARIPRSSRHPQLEQLMARRHKTVVRVLNKTDLAEPAATEAWVRYFQARNEPLLRASALTGKGISALRDRIEPVRQRLLEEARKRGILSRPIRMLVAGIPNVGKSSLINRLTQGSKARVGKKPGVTRARQWITIAEGIEMRDSPGILFPRIVGREMFVHLAATGAIREDSIPLEQVAEYLAGILDERGLLGLGHTEPAAPDDDADRVEANAGGWVDHGRLAAFARQKGMLLPGSRPDLERAAHFLLKQTREARWGPLTLELPGGPKDSGARVDAEHPPAAPPPAEE